MTWGQTCNSSHCKWGSLPAPSVWVVNHWSLASVGREKDHKIAPTHWNKTSWLEMICEIGQLIRLRVTILTGKSLFSFLRGSWGICPDPSAFSSMSFNMPSPFPRKKPRHILGLTWRNEIENILLPYSLFSLCLVGVEHSELWNLCIHFAGSWTFSRAAGYSSACKATQ